MGNQGFQNKIPLSNRVQQLEEVYRKENLADRVQALENDNIELKKEYHRVKDCNEKLMQYNQELKGERDTVLKNILHVSYQQ